MTGDEPTLPAESAPVTSGPSDAPVIAGYVVGKRLGAGGFGEVFAARRDVIDREVAIKVLHAKYSSDRDAVARFIAEARAVNLVSHPGIVEIFDFGVLADGRHYCVMERLHGTTLRELLQQRTRLPLDEALPILHDIASAIDAAHAAGIAHRDVKPENVFLLRDGGVKLIDFGLAKLVAGDVAITETGAVFGTPLYMSPEQCRGRNVDLRTDAYSFGVLAYHTLAGAPPFAGTGLELALQHLNDRPAPPSRHVDLPARIDDACLALLAKEPDERPMPLVRAVEAMGGGARVAPRRRRLAWLAVPILGAAVLAVVALRESSPPEFTVRTTAIRLDGPIGALRLSADGARLHYDDKGPRVLDLTTMAIQANDANTPHDLPRIVVVDGKPTLDDGKTRRTLELATHWSADNDPRISPDGTQVCAIEHGSLVILDLATGKKRRLADVPTFSLAARWTSDGKEILWEGRSPDGGMASNVTRVLDGVTQRSALPLLAHTTLIRSVNTLPDGRFLYCAEDGTGASLRIRDRGDATGATEHVIAPLEPWVATCSIEIASSGRAVVELWSGRPRATTIDLSMPRSELKAYDLRKPDRRVAAISPDASATYAIPWRGDRLAEVSVVSPDGPEQQQLQLCDGDVNLAIVGKDVWHIARTKHDGGETVRLRDANCAALATWELPSGIWSEIRCNATACFAVGRVATTISVWRLERATGHATQLAVLANNGTLEPQSVALSPDGSHLAVLADTAADPMIIDAATGTITNVPMHAPDGVISQGIVWAGDSEHLYVSAINFGESYSVHRLSSSGADDTIVWSSPFDWFRVEAAAVTKPVIAGSSRTFRIEFLIVDPRR